MVVVRNQWRIGTERKREGERLQWGERSRWKKIWVVVAGDGGGGR
jgi:hypothetical protein